MPVAPPVDEPLLDIKLLRLFDVLYTTRSVTRAAEQLHLSQPTASLWLGQLRTAMEDPLFVRSPTGMQPTPRADELIGTVRQTLESVRWLSSGQNAFVPTDSSRRFRVHMTDSSHVTLLPALFGRINAIAPKVRIEAASIDEATAVALRRGAADLAIGFAPWLARGFRHQRLYRQDFVCLVRGSHARIRGRLTASDYEREAHVVIVHGTGAELLGTALSALGIERRALLEVPGVLGLPAVLAETDLIATLPRHIGERLARTSGLAVFDCPIAVPGFYVQQTWHAPARGRPRSSMAAGRRRRALPRPEAAGVTRSKSPLPLTARSGCRPSSARNASGRPPPAPSSPSIRCNGPGRARPAAPPRGPPRSAG